MKKTNTLTTLGLIIFFSANTVVFAETPANTDFEVDKTEALDNLNEVKRQAIAATSYMLDTVLERKKEVARRTMPVDLSKTNHFPKNRPPVEKKPDSTKAVKRYTQKFKQVNGSGIYTVKNRPNATKKFTPVLNRTETVTKIHKNKTVNSFVTKKNVVIPPTMTKAVRIVANEYKLRTKKPLIITSASRTPARQASAMLGRIDKLGERGVQKLYRNKTAVNDVLGAYRQNSKNRANAVKAMTKVIENQIANGVYISRHLREGAIDVSLKSNSQALRSAVKKVGGRVFVEVDHYHCDVNKV